MPLSDGSTLELNTASKVRYRFSKKLREVGARRWRSALSARKQIESRDAWRNNSLIFEEMALRDIVEELNRYDRRKLEIADPAVGNVLLGGRYRPRDAEAFLQKLVAVMKIRVVEMRGKDSEGVVLRIYDHERK